MVFVMENSVPTHPIAIITKGGFPLRDISCPSSLYPIWTKLIELPLYEKKSPLSSLIFELPVLAESKPSSSAGKSAVGFICCHTSYVRLVEHTPTSTEQLNLAPSRDSLDHT